MSCLKISRWIFTRCSLAPISLHQRPKQIWKMRFFTRDNCEKKNFFVGIRRIQSILLKVALVLGAQVYRGVEFNELEEPDDDHESSGWRMTVNPTNHPVNLLNIDVLIGAEGKRVTIPGTYTYLCTFKQKNAKPFGSVHLHFGGFPPVFVHFFLIAEAAEYYLL